jgi:hypothetical protein
LSIQQSLSNILSGRRAWNIGIITTNVCHKASIGRFKVHASGWHGHQALSRARAPATVRLPPARAAGFRPAAAAFVRSSWHVSI